MTIWSPDLTEAQGPLYLALASAVARAIERQELAPGDRLPPQRDLAGHLGIALTTVTRGYAEAERRGLVRGEVGRGTFVLGGGPGGEAPRAAGVPGRIDLRPNVMLPYPMMGDLASRMARIVEARGNETVLGYAPHGGLERHREAAAAWLSQTALETTPDEVLVTAGGQHAMAVVFGTLLDPGDTLLVEPLTYSGMKSLAHFLGIQLEPLPADDQGILPDALRAACGRSNPPHALYCMSTLQNPTSAVMSDERRREIAEIVEVFRIPVVEDDTYAFLLPSRTPISAMCSYGYYLTGTSKSLFPALRIGFLRTPRGMAHRMEAAISSTVYQASPLMAEVVSRWLEDGTAARVMEWKRAEIRERQQLFVQALSPFDYRTHPFSPHGWLTMPEPWTVTDFVAQAAIRGVDVVPGEEFAVGRDTPHAVRVCVGPVPDRNQLAVAVSHLVAILNDAPAPRMTVA